MVYTPTYNWAPSCMVVWLVQKLFKFSKFPNFCWRFETWWWTMSFSSATTSDRGLSMLRFSFPPNFVELRRTSSNFALRRVSQQEMHDGAGAGRPYQPTPTNPSAVLRCWMCWVEQKPQTPLKFVKWPISKHLTEFLYVGKLSSTFGCMRQIQVPPQKFE